MIFDRVVLVEDHALVRAGLRASLATAGFTIVAEAPDGILGERAIREHVPHVVVMDLGIPGKDGIEVTRAIKNEFPAMRVLVLTMREDAVSVVRALRAGADGYCVKSSDPDVIVAGVRAVALGGAYFDPRIAQTVLASLSGTRTRSDVSPLTPRETEILALIAQGASNTDISERIYVSHGTVKAHVTEILRKMDASDRAHATAIALRNGFIS